MSTMFSMKCKKENTPGRNVVILSIECWGCPPGFKGWPPEYDYSSTLRAEVFCYVTEKLIPSPTSLPIV